MGRSDRNQKNRSLKWVYRYLLASFLCIGLFHLQAKAEYPTNYHEDSIKDFFGQRKIRLEPGQEVDFSAYGLDVNMVKVMDILSDPYSSGTSEYFYIADNKFTVPEYKGTGDFACWKADFSEVESGKARRMVTLRSAKRENAYPILYLDEQGRSGTFENPVLNPNCYYEGEEVPMLWDPVKEGYRFEGWFRDQAFTKPFEGIGKDEYGEVLLYTKFVRDDHQVTVTYELDGGTNSPFNPVYANDGLQHHLFSAYKQGYRFISWCDSPQLNAVNNNISGTDNASPVVFANFEPCTDIVPMPSKDPDIAVYYTDNQSARYNGEKTYKIPDAQKSGYAFLGWYTDPSLSPESRIREIKEGSSGAYLLYPDFVKSDYAITYENCTDPGDNPASFTTDRQLILSPGKKEGAKFDGWYADETFETPVTSIEAGQTEPVTLYAKFTDYDHHITYDFYPETEDAAKYEIDFSDYPTGYDEGTGISNLAPAKVNQPKLFEFDGWYTKSGENYTKVTSVPADSKDDIVLYAKVVRRIYKINYVLNGGQLDPADAPTTIRSDGSDPNGPVGTVMEAPKAIKEGCTFEYWVTEKGGITQKFPASITSDFTYYAGYRIKRYNVSIVEPKEEPGIKTTYSNSWTMGKVSLTTKPKQEGYDFAGYYEDEDCTKRIYWHENGWDDYSIYQKFVKPKYNIEYILPEGAGVTDKFQTMYHPLAGTKEIPKPSITDENLVFDGWYADPAYTVRIDSIPAYTEGDIRVYGKFHRRQTKVRFITSLSYGVKSAGTRSRFLPEDIVVETGSEDIILPDAWAEDHIFCGWYTNSDTMAEEDRVYSIPKEQQQAGKTVTLYAAFLELSQQIVYKMDGGENAANNPDRFASELGVESFGPAMKPGYLFTGWKDGQWNTDVTSIPQNTARINWELYATYTKTQYAITYHLNGGYITAANPGGYNEGNEAIPLAPAGRWGSEFLGWYTDPGYAENAKITEIPANSKKDYHLYARFKQVISSITYEPACVSHQNPAQYEEGIGVPALSEGGFHDMTFEGWYADDHFERKMTAILPSETGAKTLYGQFSGKITYMTGEGKNNARNPESFLYKRGTMLFPASLPGYTFVGWYENGDLNKKIDYISSKQTGNPVLCAVFEGPDGELIINKPDITDPGTQDTDPHKKPEPNPGSNQNLNPGTGSKAEPKTGSDAGNPTVAVQPKKKGTRIKDKKGENEYIVTDDNPAHPKVSYYRCLKKKKKTVKIKTTFTDQNIKYAVTGVYAKAFKGCKKLKKVTIPKSIKKLGKQIFKGCKALRTIDIKTKKLTKKNVAKKAFSGVPKKAKVRVSSKKRKAYDKLFHKKGLAKKAKVK